MVLSEIRLEARNLLQGRWSNLVPVWFLYILLALLPGTLLQREHYSLQIGFNLVVGGPFAYALARISLRLCQRAEVDINQIFEGFRDFSRYFNANLRITVYVFLRLLLLIVPGIMAALSYSMTYYIMAEDPTIRPEEAIQRSKEMMDGHKTELFCLGLSFLGWLFLSLLTAGIGLLWLQSYIQTSYGLFYQNLRKQGIREEVINTDSIPV